MPAPALGSSDTGSAPLPIWLRVSTISTAATPASAACTAGSRRRASAPISAADARAGAPPAARRQPIGVGIEPQHRLERRQPDLVEPQRALQRVAGEPRDQLGAADDEPGLRAAEQFVAAEGDEVGALRQRFGDGRLVRQAPALEVDQRAAAEILDKRNRRARAPARRVAPAGTAAVKPWIA